ncbi:MAG: efflux RND transporter periplasmic adaptor subunit [Ardenticatenaceae bacterium]|nr:efflux RND transporter periplasmic adaptor subunit [Ardenticatenaceae bacterium]
MNKRLLLTALILALATVTDWWALGRPPIATAQTALTAALSRWAVSAPPGDAPVGRLYASGFIEADPVALSAEIPARITRLAVDEGDQVVEGQVLVELDMRLLDAQLAEAEAAVALAEAQLARVEAGLRAEEIAVAEVAVTAAEAQRNAAAQAWQDALALRNTPQTLDLQIAAARAQLATTEPRIARAVALKDAAELMDGLRARQVRQAEDGIDVEIEIPGQTIRKHFEVDPATRQQAWAGWNLATTELWSGWAGLNGAVAARDAAEQQLEDLLALRANPQSLQVEAVQSEAAAIQAGAAIEVAQANLNLARAGATNEQVEVARTAVEQARAARDALRTQRQKYTLRAPIGGLVVERSAHAGEVALPGTTLLTLGRLDPIDLTVYVPAPVVGQIALEQPVAVTVDSFPDERFAGQVVWIADRAEFTPQNIQTRDERVKTVFAVKVRLANPDRKLKPGMPADAWLVAPGTETTEGRS